jgi:purine catabolism regulator
VLEERGIEEVARALAAAIGGAILILDTHCEVLASATFRRDMTPAAIKQLAAEVSRRRDTGDVQIFEPSREPLGGRALALPVASDSRRGPQAWLIGARDAGALGEYERLILQQAVTVIALELMRRRVVRDTERRLAGDVLAEAVDGDLSEQELRHRLLPFGVGPSAAVLVFQVEAPLEGERMLEVALADRGVPCLVASREGLLVAVVEPGQEDPVAIASHARDALRGAFPEARAGASRVNTLTSLRRSYHEARYALEVAAMANGTAPDVASWQDLGAFQFLLSVQDEEALTLYCDSVLGPLECGEGDYGGELLRSLEAFLEHNGQWEKAARDLACHRHTLRYRIRRIEQLTGRDLANARDRIEFWLALRARELVR